MSPRGKTGAADSGGRKAKARRKSLAPSKVSRGLDAAEIALAIDDERVAALVTQVRERGGAPIGAYREPLSGCTVLVAALPLASVQPTPFQRDLSPTHTKRLRRRSTRRDRFTPSYVFVAKRRVLTPMGAIGCRAKCSALNRSTALVSPPKARALHPSRSTPEGAHLRTAAWRCPYGARPGAREPPRGKRLSAHFESPIS